MTGDCHVQFWESAGVRFPRATRPMAPLQDPSSFVFLALYERQEQPHDRFKGTDVAMRSKRTRDSALVLVVHGRRRTDRIIALVDGRTAGQDFHRWRWTAVVGKRAQLGIRRGGSESTGSAGYAVAVFEIVTAIRQSRIAVPA